MDLRYTDAAPSDTERAAVDALLGPPPSGWEGAAERTDEDLRWARGGTAAAKERRDQLLPALHAVNDRVGWISEGALDYICRRLTVAPAEAYGVATFYAMFSVRPRPAKVLHVCTDLACAARGSSALCADLTQRLGPPGTPAEGAVWQESPCLGLCERAPAALLLQAGADPASPEPVSVNAASAEPASQEPAADAFRCSAVTAPATAQSVVAALRSPGSAPAEPSAGACVPQAGDPALVLLRRIGVVDPASLDDYRRSGGYTALRRAFSLGPAGVIREVLDAGLVGRGGAAFPTGRKPPPSRPTHPTTSSATRTRASRERSRTGC